MILFFRHFAKNILKIRIVFLSQINFLVFWGKKYSPKTNYFNEKGRKYDKLG